MFKHFPEAEYLINKTADVAACTIDLNNSIFHQSLKFFNEITDKMYYSYTVKAAESLNTVSDYAKENIKKTQSQIVDLFGDRK